MPREKLQRRGNRPFMGLRLRNADLANLFLSSSAQQIAQSTFLQLTPHKDRRNI
jgi:hypothetical protein